LLRMTHSFSEIFSKTKIHELLPIFSKTKMHELLSPL